MNFGRLSEMLKPKLGMSFYNFRLGEYDSLGRK